MNDKTDKTENKEIKNRSTNMNDETDKTENKEIKKEIEREKMQTDLWVECIHARIDKQNKKMFKKNKIMTLGRLMIRLLYIDNKKIPIYIPHPNFIKGFPKQFYSYRGYYNHLCFDTCTDKKITVSEFLTLCEECLDKEFEGYKGGEFIMDESTPIWVADYGESSGIAVTDIILSKELDECYIDCSIVKDIEEEIAEASQNPVKTLGYVWLDTCSYAPFCLGAVACEHRGGWRAFAGIGGGRCEQADIECIKAHGSTMLEPWARAMFPHIEGEYIP